MAKLDEVISGAAFGRLTVVSEPFPLLTIPSLTYKQHVNCTCSCGSGVKTFQVGKLGEKVKSCGCLNKVKQDPGDKIFLAHPKHGVMPLLAAVRLVADGKAIPQGYKGKPIAFVLQVPGWSLSTYSNFLTQGTSK